MDIDDTAVRQAIAMMLQAIEVRLEEAARIARAASACARAGGLDEGVTIALDIEQSIHEAGRLLDAMSFLNNRAIGLDAWRKAQ